MLHTALSRLLLVGVTTLGALCLAPVAAVAGGISDFSRSIDDDDDDDDNRRSSWSNDNDSGARWSDCEETTEWNGSEWVTNECDPDLEDYAILAQVFGRFITGYRPEMNFSYGATPFQGRGYLNRTEAYVASSERLQWSAPELRDNVHYGFLRLRGDGLAVTDGTGMAGGVSGRITSTFTPGFSFGYLSAHDHETQENLNKGQIALEPTLWVDEYASWSYSVGYVHYSSAEGRLNSGALFGVALELYPVNPVFFEVRLQTEALVGTGASDIYAGTGLQLAGPLMVQAGYRRIGTAGVAIHMGTLGFGVQAGL